VNAASGQRRVVVTGRGVLGPLGHDWPSVQAWLKTGRNAVRHFPEWGEYKGLNSRLGVPAQPFDLPDHYNRKATRSMGRVALLATRASELALVDAGLLGDPLLKSGKVGISYGSSAGTPSSMSDFGRMLAEFNTQYINATTYIRMMAHTAPVNMGVFFGITGRIITTSSACTSGSQGIGYAYEAIKAGKQVAMLAGGSEELDVTATTVFDTLFATSSDNDAPETTPRPFDASRNGLVIGEGGCTLVLEDLDHALARGATIHAEIVGYGTNSDGQHVTQPNAATMAQAMRLALEDAGLPPDAIALRQRARHRDRTRRHRRNHRDPCGLRRAHADQFAEELHRAHAGRLRRAGGLGDAGDDARGLVRIRRPTCATSIRAAARSTTSSPAKRAVVA
jgi:3-oxoacyl-[acyl-carrier-protein] synthase II